MRIILDEDTLRRHAAYLEGIFTYDELANLPRVDHESLWYSVEAWFRKYVQERRWIREYNCIYCGERSLPYEAPVDEFTERITYPLFTTPNCRVATYYAMDGPVYKLCIRPDTRHWFFSELCVVERTNRLCHILKCAIAGMSGSEMLDECMAEPTTPYYQAWKEQQLAKDSRTGWPDDLLVALLYLLHRTAPMLVPPVIVMRGAFKDELPWADDDVQSVRPSRVAAAEVIILGPGHITDVQKAMTCPRDTSKEFDTQMQQKDDTQPTGSLDEDAKEEEAEEEDAKEEDAEEEDAEEEDAEEELSVQHDQVIQELQQKVQQLSREATKQRKIISKIRRDLMVFHHRRGPPFFQD